LKGKKKVKKKRKEEVKN